MSNKFSNADRDHVIEILEHKFGELRQPTRRRKFLQDETGVWYIVVGGENWHGINEDIVDTISASPNAARLVVARKEGASIRVFIGDFKPFQDNKNLLSRTTQKQYHFTLEDDEDGLRVREIPNYTLSDLQAFQSELLIEDLNSIKSEKIDSTTKQALINARIGQGRFRTDVLQLWGNCCSVTGSVTMEAIRASHIKPWRESTNEERLDPNNGLPLVASLDALFDVGLISFDSSGRSIISSKMTITERQIFGVEGKSLMKHPSPKMVHYLEYHRRKHGFNEECFP